MRYYKIINIISNNEENIIKNSFLGKTYLVEKLKVGARAFFKNVDNIDNYFLSEKIISILRDKTNNKNIDILIICTENFKIIVKEYFVKENSCDFKCGEKLIYIDTDLNSIKIVNFIDVCIDIEENYLVRCRNVNSEIKKYDKYRLFNLKDKSYAIDLIHKEINNKIYNYNLERIQKNNLLDIEINKTKSILNRNNLKRTLFNEEKLDKDIYFNNKKLKRLSNRKKKNIKEYKLNVENLMLKLNYLIDLIKNA